MMTNDVGKLTNGRAQYTLMCDEDGGTVDDLLVYKKETIITFLLSMPQILKKICMA